MKCNAYRTALRSAAVLVWAALAGAALAQAAGIGWETRGALQICLEGKAQGWIAAKVELVVNEDPAAGEVDDKAVATWATQALADCAAKAGKADAASEERFMRYMAHWREHIYKGADEIRKRARPD
jgi:hypothetical protein